MEKKLTTQGPKNRKSYTVTLPIEWIKNQKLDKNKQVELTIVSDRIIISSQKHESQRAIIDEKDYPDVLIKVLQIYYRKGFDELKIFIHSPQSIAKIAQIMEKHMIGFEIIEQKKEYIIIKDITKDSSDEFNIVLRRVFLLLLEFFEASESAEIDSLDRNISRLVNYCQRIIIKRGHVQYADTPLLFMMLDRLEKLKDEFVWLLGPALHKKQSVYIKELHTLLRTAYELFYTFDPQKYSSGQNRTYLLKHKILREEKSASNMHIHNSMRILNSLYADIYAVKCSTSERLKN
ncbi:MAG: AbrB/MazE/SpoVT family DNA-binding domain-containing protein [Candidatus Woesearchaeota archaeon]